MKKFNLLILFIVLTMTVMAQKSQLVFVNTIEYLDFLDGGMSVMYIHHPDGETEKIELRGLWSLANYVSDKKFTENQTIIHEKIREFLDQGFQLIEVATNTRQRSPQGSGYIPSYMITRYILLKP